MFTCTHLRSTSFGDQTLFGTLYAAALSANKTICFDNLCCHIDKSFFCYVDLYEFLFRFWSSRMSLQSNLLLNSKLWLQQYSSSLNMAFGKKSFLIRDILENRSQSMPSLSSTSLIDWIIRNRVDYFGQGFNFTENNQLEVDTNADTQLLSCDPPEQDSFNANLAFNPLLQNWFSFYRPNSLISGLFYLLPKILFINFLMFSFQHHQVSNLVQLHQRSKVLSTRICIKISTTTQFNNKSVRHLITFNLRIIL